jgi:protein gp37
MAEKSKIEWTDATVNFWWGCTKVGPGCDHCYAEAMDKRFGPSHWGTGTPRRQIASAANTLAKLNRQGGKRVFIQSMSDLFDNEVPGAWFDEAWMHIHNATHCHIQIVTKRISRVEKAIAESGPPTWPRHAGLMITVVNQAEADRDIPRLLALKAKLGIPWVGLSMEPLLGPVDLTNMDIKSHADARKFGLIGAYWINALTGKNDDMGRPCQDVPKLDWILVGGESGPKARPLHPGWARSLRDQCQAAGVPFFFKQWGEWGPDIGIPPGRDASKPGGDPIMEGKGPCGYLRGDEWVFVKDGYSVPLDKPQRTGECVYRLGKKLNGRLLDAQEHNAMPGVL